MKARRSTGLFIFCLLLALLAFSRPVLAQYTINAAQTNQVIDGFGVNINHRNWNNDEIKPVLDTMIGQGGFSIFRVVFDNTDWAPSNNMTLASYNAIYGSARFAKLWNLAAYLNQKGITNGLMFNFQGPGALWMGGLSLTSGYEPQWAQMISSLIVYARNVRHLNFYLVGPDNEPDNSAQLVGVGCNTTQYITMLKLLIQNLNSNGITDVRFVGPDVANTGSTAFLSAMLGSAQVMSNTAFFGAHSYVSGGTGSANVAGAIASSAYPNMRFWMTEYNIQCDQCYHSTYNSNNYTWSTASGTAQYLIYHLANGASAGLAWEGWDSYYELLPLPWLPSGQQAAGWSFYGLFGVDNTNAAVKTYTPRKSFYALSQISAFVPPGSVRIGVSGSQNSSFMMLAFYHPASGRVTLTGFNTGGRTTIPITLLSLPAVTNFALYYTDANTNLNQSTNYAVTNASFTATIPSNCVFTLTGFDPFKIAVSVQITNPASGASFTAPASIPLQASASTTIGAIDNVTFYSGGVPLGTSSNAPYSVSWDSVPPGNYTVTAIATGTLGQTNVSPGITLTVAGDPAQVIVSPTNVTISPPTNAVVVPFGSQQFTATVVDALGNTVSPQPPVGWWATGGAIDGGGWFTAGGNVGGPFPIIATGSNGLSGSVTVTIVSNINLAPYGIAYTWYNLATNTANSPQYDAPGLNDGNTNVNVSLLAEYDGSWDLTGYYEAAGIVWSSPQMISNLVFINGSTSNGDGTFASGLQLQFTLDGVTWFPANSAWAVSPPYVYNSNSNAPARYTFAGSLTTVLGVRCIGKVNSTQTDSGFVNATEVQAFQGAPPPLQSTVDTNGVTVSWTSPVTNCVLQTSTNLPVSWTTVTNARQYAGTQTSVIISPTADLQFFRLVFP